MTRTRRKAPRRQRNPYGGNPMPGMMRTMGQTTMGIVGIGAMTSLGLGAMNMIKPS